MTESFHFHIQSQLHFVKGLVQISICSCGGPASCRAALRFGVTMETTDDDQDFEGKEVKGLSSAQRRNQNLLFAETAALKIDVRRRRVCGNCCHGNSRLLNQDISRRSVGARVRRWVYFRTFQVTRLIRLVLPSSPSQPNRAHRWLLTLV